MFMAMHQWVFSIELSFSCMYWSVCECKDVWLMKGRKVELVGVGDRRVGGRWELEGGEISRGKK